MTSCNVEMTSCKAEKTRKKSSERHDPSSKVNVIDHDSINKSYLMRNTSLERDTSVEPPINNSLESDVIDSQCNLVSNCSQTKKKKKKNPKIKQNAKIDGQGETIKDDSTGTNSCHESVVDADTRTDFKTAMTSELSQSQKKGKRKRKKQKQKLSATEINDKAHVPVPEPELIKVGENALISGKQSDSPTSPSTGLMEKHDDNGEYGILDSVADTSTKTDLKTATIKDDSTGTNSCHESIVDADTRTDFKIAMTSELSQSQKKGKRKRKRKKQKLGVTEINDKAHVPVAEPDLIKMGENALISGKQSDSPASPSTSLMEKHDDNGEYGILESVADTSTKSDLKIAPLSELSQSQRKRNRKKQKRSATAINDKAHVPVSEPDLIKVEENALISEKQSDSPTNPCTSLTKKHDDNGEAGLHESVVDVNTKTDLETTPPLSKRSRRKRNRKKQKCSATAINDKAHIPVAELDFIKVEENALISEKQGDSPTSPCTSLTKKHDDNSEAGLLESVVDVNTKTNLETTPLSELGRSQKKKKRKKDKLTATMIDDKPQVPLAVLDSIKVGENALISEEGSGCPRSPSSNLMNKLDNNGEAGIILDEKENIKTHQMKENIGTYRKRRQSSDSEENVKSINVTRLTSSDLNEVHSFELSENELQRVQAGEQTAAAKIVENAFNENVSSNCSSGDFGLVESKNIIETKKDADLHVPIKEDNLAQVSHSSLEGPREGCSNKKLLILDVNGLLADIVPYCYDPWKPDIIISRKAVFKRPFCDDFLQFCFEKFNVGVWSSRTKKNMDMVIDFLMGDSRHKLKFCWHQSHCTDTGFTTVENLDKPLLLKELKKLWDKYEPDLPWSKGEYNESNTLLLDDSPYKALSNPAHTAIFPHSYRYKDARDSSLGPGGDLRVYLEQIAKAQNVQEFVAQNPFGQRAITEANPSWGFYQRILNSFSYKTQNVASSSGTEQ